ncbi:MAG: class I SAM-dependent methyltransferase [Nitrospirae bacterium]|nr:class I SAM-dependent methyltransferase [Nitrospirota bacterium]
MNKNTEVKQFWDSQAAAHGETYLATMPDKFLKELEIDNISKYLKPGTHVADIGCGNGYSTFHYAETVDITIQGIDYSEAMIEQAHKAWNRLPDNLKARVSFRPGDVKGTGFDSSMFDTVITDRCLINLTTRNDQENALKELHRILKPNGYYVMCEDTEQGLHNLNQVREYVGLEPIKVRWHNLYIDETHILTVAQELFNLVEVVKFSSFYYLASRIINGKMAQEEGVEPKYDSDVNRVAALCSSKAVFGDFGPLKLFVFQKI